METLIKFFPVLLFVIPFCLILIIIFLDLPTKVGYKIIRKYFAQHDESKIQIKKSGAYSFKDKELLTELDSLRRENTVYNIIYSRSVFYKERSYFRVTLTTGRKIEVILTEYHALFSSPMLHLDGEI